jgi:hypothetical protein
MFSTTDKTNMTNNTLLTDNMPVNDSIEEPNILPIRNISNMVNKDLSNLHKQDIDDIENENINMNNLSKYTTGNLILVYDENEHKFTFYNSNKSILGSFNFKQIVKYIGRQIEPSFYNFVDSGYSEELIKSMLGEVLIDPITGKINIILKSHLESPFMGNLDLLIRLNNSFCNYEHKELLLDISTMQNDKTQYNIKLSIKQFIYLLINHTLKIIAIASEEIQNDNTQEQMKQKLLKYSVALTYRISSFMKEHLDNYNNQYKLLYEQMQKLANIKSTINTKINNLETKINKQNELIFSLINGKKPEQSTLSSNKPDFAELFKDDNESKNNFFDSEFVIENNNESYLLTDIDENTDMS